MIRTYSRSRLRALRAEPLAAPVGRPVVATAGSPRVVDVPVVLTREFSSSPTTSPACLLRIGRPSQQENCRIPYRSSSTLPCLASHAASVSPSIRSSSSPAHVSPWGGFEPLTYGSGGPDTPRKPPRKRPMGLSTVKLVCKFPLIPKLTASAKNRRPTAWDRVSSDDKRFDGDWTLATRRRPAMPTGVRPERG
jgi:hypothetical protein